MELIRRAERQGEKTALISEGQTYSYAQLLEASAAIGSALLQGRNSLDGARIAFMVPPSFDYVAVQWGIWRAGGVAVPLALSYPLPELRYVVETVSAELVVTAEGFHAQTSRLGLPVLDIATARATAPQTLPHVDPASTAMLLFTSGTTSKPKGVVISHANIAAQLRSLSEAWQWQRDDHILNVLPLHHVHGIVNVLTCALWNGATCEFMPKFDVEEAWTRFLDGSINVFMAVPTVYAKLIRAWDGQSADVRAQIRSALESFRLMVSGSAALPVSVLETWRRISGHTLLERYGMTEIGMALSNPYAGERRPGHVGLPLPGVEMRLVDGAFGDVPEGEPGEIIVRGPNVFSHYWNRPEATAEAFRDGWFRTGDMAVLNDGSYKILGRSSVDILKSGGYKISALEIEEVFRQHAGIRDCAVVGVPDAEWGERIAMALVPLAEAPAATALQEWGRERLAHYKLPREFRVVDALPRNALGKVMKPAVKALFEAKAEN